MSLGGIRIESRVERVANFFPPSISSRQAGSSCCRFMHFPPHSHFLPSAKFSPPNSSLSQYSLVRDKMLLNHVLVCTIRDTCCRGGQNFSFFRTLAAASRSSIKTPSNTDPRVRIIMYVGWCHYLSLQSSSRTSYPRPVIIALSIYSKAESKGAVEGSEQASRYCSS